MFLIKLCKTHCGSNEMSFWVPGTKHKFKINRIEYINKRRWNIYLKNNVKLMLSESFPKNSLKNFIDIEKKLSKTDMNNISNFDLRNIDKTLITYIE